MGYALLDGTCVSSMINKEYTVNGYRFITQFDNGWIAIRFLDDVPTNCINQFSNIGAFNEYDNPHYFMSVYEWLDDGSMKWVDAFGSEKLQGMSCLERN